MERVRTFVKDSLAKGRRNAEASSKLELAWPWINAAAFFVAVIVNALAGSTTVIGGKNTGTVSDEHPTLITPAGWTFGIWGIIYTAIALFLVFSLLPPKRGNYIVAHRISWLFAVNMVSNLVWIIMWGYEVFPATLVFMAIILATNIAMYVRINVNYGPKGWSRVVDPRNGRIITTWEYWLFQVWISLYLAWISAASILNVAITIKAYQTETVAWTEQGWAILMLCVIFSLGVTVQLWRSDFVFGFVVSWALLGIATKQFPINAVVGSAAYALSGVHAVLTLETIVKLIWKRFWKKEKVVSGRVTDADKAGDLEADWRKSGKDILQVDE